MLLMKIVAPILFAVCTLLSTFGAPFADTFNPEDFPQIDSTVQQGDTLRVMSFNVRFEDVNEVSKTKRVNVVAGQINKIAPDVIGVQEATPFWMMNLWASLPAYSSIGVGRDNGKNDFFSGEAAAIFYNRQTVKLLDSGNFWLSETPDEPSIYPGANNIRICTWGLFEQKSTGKQFVQFNTHLDFLSAESRDYGSKLILRYAFENFPDNDIIVTGDLNSSIGDAAYMNFADELLDASKIGDDVQYYPTFHNGNGANAYTLDHIFVSDGVDCKVFRTVTTGINGRYSSDHFPIYADVRLRDMS